MQGSPEGNSRKMIKGSENGNCKGNKEAWPFST